MSHPAAPDSVSTEQCSGTLVQRVLGRLVPPEQAKPRRLPQVLLHGSQSSMQQLLLEPRPGTCKRAAAGWDSHAWSWGDRGWAPPPPPPLPNPNILHLQVLGASEQPSQFSLTNAAGTHTTSEGVSSPTPGELLFSSFHNLLSEPYFWSLPTSFRGDKVGRAEGEPRQGGHWENRDSVARLKSPAESLSTPVPGDFLRRRAALHRDPAAPAQFCTPAQTATGGVAGQQHCVGTSCLKGAQPWPAQQLHSALPRGEPHPVPSGSSLCGPQHPGFQEWISCPFLYSKRGSGLMGSQPHGSTC